MVETVPGRPLAVQFRDRSEGNPVRWQWYFGDGFASTEKDPLHEYRSAATYLVSLYVKDNFEVVDKNASRMMLYPPLYLKMA